ncbi:MAG: cyclic nucleotide-binding domain-containing protein [Xanthomonadales bacterium]|jgi:hypothetical protein|nr:cyclic nucleotide-binding domain-containing protein [Xanthomonadales bacterium]MBK7144042.1 cyclic nucleotide-binding domain-containing protein [Xanthomonadales bacterium]MCC6561603.1 cyclic nucleotide-binding domain-containing protein [Xanthomonadales bacterium]
MSQEMFLMAVAGQTIFREGDDGAEMFIIESGSIEIRRAARGAEPLATLGPGDFFGEMAILEDQPRFATALARTPSKLLRIDRAAFPGVVAGNIEIAIRIMRKLAGRLRRAELRGAEAAPALPVETLRTPSPSTEFTPMPKASASRPPAQAASGASATAMVLVHGPSGTRFALRGRDEFLVGRPDPVTASFPDVNLGAVDAQRSLSRRHAKILRDGSGWQVREEVGTLNGTAVNGQRLKSGVAVMFGPGDVLRFGNVDVTASAEA